MHNCRLMKYWMSTWLFFSLSCRILTTKICLIIMSLFSTFLSLQIIISTILTKDVYDQEAIRLKGSFHYWLTNTCCICQVSWDPPESLPGGAPAACPLIWDESWERSHHQSTYHETETHHHQQDQITGLQYLHWTESGPRSVPGQYHLPGQETSEDCSQDSSPGQPTIGYG